MLLLVNIYLITQVINQVVIPGWNDQVQELTEEALSWHAYWKAHDRPSSGYVAEMHRIIRARYHRAISHIEKRSYKNPI